MLLNVRESSIEMGLSGASYLLLIHTANCEGEELMEMGNLNSLTSCKLKQTMYMMTSTKLATLNAVQVISQPIY